MIELKAQETIDIHEGTDLRMCKSLSKEEPKMQEVQRTRAKRPDSTIPTWKLLSETAVIEDVDQVCCFLCGLDEPQRLERCPHCQLIWFCGPDHFEVHRNPRKNHCFPFIIKRSPEKGRYMVAVRNIDPLETILVESPAVVGPYSKSKIGCLQCFKRVEKTYICSGCRLPVCDEQCAQGSLHQLECQFFQEKERNKLEDDDNPENFHHVNKGDKKLMEPRDETTYICVTPLRMLLLKESDAKTFNKINMLMDHTEAKIVFAQGALATQQLFKLVLLMDDDSSSMKDKFTYREIQRMIGILKTNGMKLESHGDQGSPGVALYPVYCLINHACLNNTNYVKYPDLHLELRAQLPIKKGEEIFTRYISSTIGNARRREDILKYWFFHCECIRCSDTTELGTFMSAVRCLDCRSGFLLPMEALSYDSPWICDNCNTVSSNSTVDEVVSTIEKQIGSIVHGDVEDLEEMLFHYQELLHPNHYILIDLMHNLVHLYAGKTVLSRPEKERKIQLCQIVLDTLGRVDPGFTKWRGTLLQELIHSLMMVSKEDHLAHRITEQEYQKRLMLCTRKLREAKMCLYGGFTSIEDYITQQTQKGLKLDVRKSDKA